MRWVKGSIALVALCAAAAASMPSRAAVFDIDLSGAGSDVTVLNDMQPSGYYYRNYHADFATDAPIVIQNGDVLNFDLDLTQTYDHLVQVVDSGLRRIYLTADLSDPLSGGGSAESITLLNGGDTIGSQSGLCPGCIGLNFVDTQPSSRLFITEVKGSATVSGLSAPQTISSFQFGFALRDWLGVGPEPDPVGSSAAPEPSSWALMIAGLGLVGAAMRRRGRVPAPSI